MLINQIPLLIAVATMHLYKAIMLKFISFIHVYQSEAACQCSAASTSLKDILVSATSSWAVLFYLSNCLNLNFFSEFFCPFSLFKEKRRFTSSEDAVLLCGRKNSALFLHLLSISMSAYFECISIGFLRVEEVLVTETTCDTIGSYLTICLYM